MGKALPSKLPECFHWREEENRRRLFLGDVEVLEIRPQRQGWIVLVYLTDSLQPQPVVVVRSIDAGVRWGAQWSKLHTPQLLDIAARQRRHAERNPALSNSA